MNNKKRNSLLKNYLIVALVLSFLGLVLIFKYQITNYATLFNLTKILVNFLLIFRIAFFIYLFVGIYLLFTLNRNDPLEKRVFIIPLLDVIMTFLSFFLGIVYYYYSYDPYFFDYITEGIGFFIFFWSIYLLWIYKPQR